MFPSPCAALITRVFNLVRYTGLYLAALALTLWGPTLVLADGMVPDTSVVIVNEADGEASVSVTNTDGKLALLHVTHGGRLQAYGRGGQGALCFDRPLLDAADLVIPAPLADSHCHDFLGEYPQTVVEQDPASLSVSLMVPTGQRHGQWQRGPHPGGA